MEIYSYLYISGRKSSYFWVHGIRYNSLRNLTYRPYFKMFKSFAFLYTLKVRGKICNSEKFKVKIVQKCK